MAEYTLKYTLIDNNTHYEVSGYEGTPTDIIIPKEYEGKPITSIGTNAFRDCTSLTSMEIANSVTSIGGSAFSNCPSLTSIEIPNSVTSIGDYAFRSCSSLTSINILSKTPANLISINAFNNVNSDIKFYCYSSALEKYKTATNWSGYADNFVADDMRLTFVTSANAQKRYFASKEEVNTLLEINTMLKSQISELQSTVNSLQEILSSMSPNTPESISTIFNTEA